MGPCYFTLVIQYSAPLDYVCIVPIFQTMQKCPNYVLNHKTQPDEVFVPDHELFQPYRPLSSKHSPQTFIFWLSNRDTFEDVFQAIQKNVINCSQYLDLGMIHTSNHLIFIEPFDSSVIFEFPPFQMHPHIGVVTLENQGAVIVQRIGHYKSKSTESKVIKNVDYKSLFPSVKNFYGHQLIISILPTIGNIMPEPVLNNGNGA